MFDFYKDDSIDAVTAKFEAQKIAFAPLCFQAVRALRDMGILNEISKARKQGITISELSQKTGISLYGIKVLVEMGLGMGVIKVNPNSEEGKQSSDIRLKLGKIGFFLIADEMTRVNMDFTQDICYRGAENLEESIRQEKPAGLPHLGPWNTVYEGLSQLTEQQKKSWFGFDHFYSDQSFTDALPIVFEKPVKHLFDIGGNTAKWAIACCKYNQDVRISIIDLPGQTAVAQKNAQNAGFGDRIDTIPCNVLENATEFPKGADAIWMSQFLDCFSLEQVKSILAKIHKAIGPETEVYVLEPLWDKQKFEAAAYSLQATSLYFTCIANGNSKMYRYAELKEAIESVGFELKEAHHNLGPSTHSLLRFRKK